MSANTTDWMLMNWDDFDLTWFDLLLDRGAGTHYAPIPISIADKKYGPAHDLINWLKAATCVRPASPLTNIPASPPTCKPNG